MSRAKYGLFIAFASLPGCGGPPARPPVRPLALEQVKSVTFTFEYMDDGAGRPREILVTDQKEIAKIYNALASTPSGKACLAEQMPKATEPSDSINLKATPDQQSRLIPVFRDDLKSWGPELRSLYFRYERLAKPVKSDPVELPPGL